MAEQTFLDYEIDGHDLLIWIGEDKSEATLFNGDAESHHKHNHGHISSDLDSDPVDNNLEDGAVDAYFRHQPYQKMILKPKKEEIEIYLELPDSEESGREHIATVQRKRFVSFLEDIEVELEEKFEGAQNDVDRPKESIVKRIKHKLSDFLS